MQSILTKSCFKKRCATRTNDCGEANKHERFRHFEDDRTRSFWQSAVGPIQREQSRLRHEDVEQIRNGKFSYSYSHVDFE
jgi:hypothetical protein